MKVLIWILCIFVNALVTTLLKEAGILLGGIPSAVLFGGTLWIARTLCQKLDEQKANNAVEQNAEIHNESKESADNKIQCSESAQRN